MTPCTRCNDPDPQPVLLADGVQTIQPGDYGCRARFWIGRSTLGTRQHGGDFTDEFIKGLNLLAPGEPARIDLGLDILRNLCDCGHHRTEHDFDGCRDLDCLCDEFTACESITDPQE